MIIVLTLTTHMVYTVGYMGRKGVSLFLIILLGIFLVPSICFGETVHIVGEAGQPAFETGFEKEKSASGFESRGIRMNLQYWKDFTGMVHLEGCFEAVNKEHVLIFVLPSEFRPGKTVDANLAVAHTTGSAESEISSATGGVYINSGFSLFTYCENVQFPAVGTTPWMSTGPEGKEGKEGKEGPEGKEGKEGLKGLTGDKGPEGKEGKTGSEGKEGKEGPIGPMGLTGLEGPEGKEGPEGLPGPEGKEGKEGKEGPVGISEDAFVAAQKETNEMIEIIGWCVIGTMLAGMVAYMLYKVLGVKSR